MKVHFARGALFENFVVLEILKTELNAGNLASLYYWRDNHQNEVDLLQEKDGKLIAYEIKSSETYHSDFLKSLKYFGKIVPEIDLNLIYAGDINQAREGVKIFNFRDI